MSKNKIYYHILVIIHYKYCILIIVYYKIYGRKMYVIEKLIKLDFLICSTYKKKVITFFYLSSFNFKIV